MSEALQQMLGLLRRTDRRTRLVVGVGTGVAIALLLGWVVLGAGTEYRIVADSLTREDAARLLARLDEAGIRHRVVEAGRAIEVDASRFDEAESLRIHADVAAPKVSGYAGLFESSFGLTREQQEQKARIALEQEIAATISGLDGIESARVHLTLPKRSFNQRDTRTAKASVSLSTKRMKVPPASQVEAIVQLVAHAVDGLDGRDVVVTDAARGLLLSNGDRDEDTEARTATRRYEAYLEDKAQSALDEAFGPRRAIVRVGVELDQESVRTTRSTPDPASKVTVSEKTRSGTSRGSSGAATTAALTDVAASGGTRTEDTESVFAHGTTVVQTSKDAGGVRRMTLGVMLDETLKDRQTDLVGVLKGAVAFKEGRDAISVTAVPFAPVTVSAVGGDGAGAASDGIDIGHWVSLALPVLAAVGLLMLFLKGSKGARGALAAATKARAELELTRRGGGRGARDLSRARRDVAQMIDSEPQAGERVVRRWLEEAPAQP